MYDALRDPIRLIDFIIVITRQAALDECDKAYVPTIHDYDPRAYFDECGYGDEVVQAMAADTTKRGLYAATIYEYRGPMIKRPQLPVCCLCCRQEWEWARSFQRHKRQSKIRDRHIPEAARADYSVWGRRRKGTSAK